MPSGFPPAYSQSQFFSASGSFLVPANVNVVHVTMCGGGASGGGGDTTAATGGGGAGGNGAWSVFNWPMTVAPGATLTVTVGAGATAPGVATDGNEGGISSVTGGLNIVPMALGGAPGLKGVNTTGGSTSSGPAVYGFAGPPVSAGGVAGGAAGSACISYGKILTGTPGGAGAGATNSGGTARQFRSSANTAVAGGAAGGGSGGGAGGSTPTGSGGTGGGGGATTGSPGNAPAAGHYGGGGGGGGRNAAGGAGLDGFVLISWVA